MDLYPLVDQDAYVAHQCPTCRICGIADQIQLLATDVARWKEGAYVQDVFYWMNADEREVLISGTHAPCWEKMMGDET